MIEGPNAGVKTERHHFHGSGASVGSPDKLQVPFWGLNHLGD